MTLKRLLFLSRCILVISVLSFFVSALILVLMSEASVLYLVVFPAGCLIAYFLVYGILRMCMFFLVTMPGWAMPVAPYVRKTYWLMILLLPVMLLIAGIFFIVQALRGVPF